MRRGGSATSPASVVVIDVTNGDILAMPSMPSFDPEQFLRRDQQATNGRCCRRTTICRWSTRRWRASIRRARRSSRRWRWRCSMPASTASSASIAPAPIQLGNHVFHCDKRHGPVDMDAAVVHSCDIYFYDMCLPRRSRKARADGPLDGLRREVRPAVRQPALRDHPRPRLDDAQISSRSGRDTTRSTCRSARAWC